MTPAPPNLAQIIAQEITAEVGNALEPEDRKRFCEHIEKHIIQPRIQPMAQLAEESKAVASALDEAALDYFVSGYWKISNQVEDQSKRLKEALSKL